MGINLLALFYFNLLYINVFSLKVLPFEKKNCLIELVSIVTAFLPIIAGYQLPPGRIDTL